MLHDTHKDATKTLSSSHSHCPTDAGATVTLLPISATITELFRRYGIKPLPDRQSTGVIRVDCGSSVRQDSNNHIFQKIDSVNPSDASGQHSFEAPSSQTPTSNLAIMPNQPPNDRSIEGSSPQITITGNSNTCDNGLTGSPSEQLSPTGINTVAPVLGARKYSISSTTTGFVVPIGNGLSSTVILTLPNFITLPTFITPEGPGRPPAFSTTMPEISDRTSSTTTDILISNSTPSTTMETATSPSLPSTSTVSTTSTVSMAQSVANGVSLRVIVPGVVVGGCVGLSLLVVGLWFFCWRKPRQLRQHQQMMVQEPFIITGPRAGTSTPPTTIVPHATRCTANPLLTTTTTLMKVTSNRRVTEIRTEPHIIVRREVDAGPFISFNGAIEGEILPPEYAQVFRSLSGDP